MVRSLQRIQSYMQMESPAKWNSKTRLLPTSYSTDKNNSLYFCPFVGQMKKNFYSRMHLYSIAVLPLNVSVVASICHSISFFIPNNDNPLCENTNKLSSLPATLSLQ